MNASTNMHAGGRPVYECIRCGECCKWPGPVRISDKEITNMAGFLEISRSDFLSRYTRLIDDRKALSLTEKRDGSCIFLKDNRCIINDVKPKQCRDFPNEWNFEGFMELCNAKIVSE